MTSNFTPCNEQFSRVRPRLWNLLLCIVFGFAAQPVWAATDSPRASQQCTTGRNCVAFGSMLVTKELGSSSQSRKASTPQSTISGVVVLPNLKTLISAYVEYNTQTCAQISSGAWTVTAPPKSGTTSTGTVTGTLGNGACPGVQFTFGAIYYTWTSTQPLEIGDAFSATWNAPDFSFPTDVSLQVAHITVSSVDLTNGTLAASFTAPAKMSGPITVTFIGDKVNSALPPDGKNYGSGDASIVINRPSIVRGKYSSLKIDWVIGGVTINHPYVAPGPWNVLGNVRYSQYNVPAESNCTGAATPVFIVDSVDSCIFTEGSLLSDFISQTGINGTGTSNSYGLVKVAGATGVRKYCKGKFPALANQANTFVQVSSVTGACNSVLTPGTSVAVNPLRCSSRDYLVNRPENTNFGTRITGDLCPACSGDYRGAEDHIDNLTPSQQCLTHLPNDLGNFWTFEVP